MSEPPLSDAALLRRFQTSTNQPPGSKTLGFEMVAVDQAQMRVEARFTADPAFCNPMGQIQGGFLCAMLDECMSVAGVVASGMTAFMPTLELKTSFLRAARAGGYIHGEGRVVKKGRSVFFLEGALRDEAGETLATATATAMPRPFKEIKAKAGD